MALASCSVGADKEAKQRSLTTKIWLKQCKKNFQALGTTIIIIIHYLSSHLDKFPENLGDVSKNKESDFTKISIDYGGPVPRSMWHPYNVRLLQEPYAWLPQQTHKIKSYKRSFFHVEQKEWIWLYWSSPRLCWSSLSLCLSSLRMCWGSPRLCWSSPRCLGLLQHNLGLLQHNLVSMSGRLFLPMLHCT